MDNLSKPYLPPFWALNIPQIGGQRDRQMIPTIACQPQPQESQAMFHPRPIAPVKSRLLQIQHLQPVMTSYGHAPQSRASNARRGILPSAPRRPDADGKFPCPHCTKTFLQFKYLKRHLTCHTGDRPYMCVLCRDTFSRSDILKRHFQKCSIRRGNPTGASHLSRVQAHLKTAHPGPRETATTMSNENDVTAANGMGSMTDPGIHLFGIIPDRSMNDTAPGLTEEQVDQLSRSNSLKRLGNGTGRDGWNMAIGRL